MCLLHARTGFLIFWAFADVVPGNALGCLRLRILLCGRPQAIERLQSSGDRRVETIDLASLAPNSPDVLLEKTASPIDDLEKVILQRSEWREAREQLGPEQQSFRSDFPRDLAASVQGDYSILEDKLRRLHSCKNVEDMQEILLIRQTDSLEELAQRIESFTSTLSMSEVDELNEILAWVSAGTYSTNTAILREALSWRFEKQFLLERTISTRYSDLLVIDGSEQGKTVRWASSAVATYLFDAEKGLEGFQRDIVRHQTPEASC